MINLKPIITHDHGFNWIHGKCHTKLSKTFLNKGHNSVKINPNRAGPKYPPRPPCAGNLTGTHGGQFTSPVCD